MSKENKDLSCQLCSKTYNDPRILPCLHSFCEQCLHAEVEKAECMNNMQCPTCRSVCQVPLRGAIGFHQNLHLAFEVTVAEYISKLLNGSLGTVCNFCTGGCTGSAEGFCCVCCKVLCKEASLCHIKVPQFAHHTVIKLDPSSIAHLTIMRPTPLFCNQNAHERNEVKAWCEACSCFVCQDCTLENHLNHRVAKLSSLAKVYRDEMEQVLTLSHQYAAKLPPSKDACDKALQELENSKQTAVLTIENTFEKLFQTLEEKKKSLLLGVEDLSLSKKTAINLQKEQIEMQQRDLDRYIEATSRVLQTHADHEIVALEHLLTTEMQAIMNKADVDPTVHQGGAIVSVATDSLVTELSQFNCTKEAQLLSKGHSTSPEITTSATALPKTASSATLPKKKRFHPYCDRASTGVNGSHLPSPSSSRGTSSHTPRGLDVSVARNYCALGKPIMSISVPSPECIAVRDNGDIFVTSCYNVYVFDPTGNQKNILGCSDWYAKSIFIKGGMLFMTDQVHNCFHILSTDGKVQRRFGNQGVGQRQFNRPTALLVDSNNRVIVSDESNTIQVFSLKGSPLLTIYGNGSGYHCFCQPCALAQDHLGNIHVAASKTAAIKVFSPGGAYVREYGNLNNPTGVAVDSQGYCFVASYDGLSIYNPQGTLVHQVEIHSSTAVNVVGRSVLVATDTNKILKYSV